MKFKSYIGTLDSNVYNVHIHVPKKVYAKFLELGTKRVLCTVNENEYFHAGLMPKGDGDYFIMMNKKRMKEFALQIGDKIEVLLEEDTSKYGMKMPEEFEEVVLTDEEGQQLFEQLTDGKKRNLIHLVSMVKSTDIRISKALTILDHLKANNGKIDFKLLNEAMKVRNRM